MKEIKEKKPPVKRTRIPQSERNNEAKTVGIISGIVAIFAIIALVMFVIDLPNIRKQKIPQESVAEGNKADEQGNKKHLSGEDTVDDEKKSNLKDIDSEKEETGRKESDNAGIHEDTAGVNLAEGEGINSETLNQNVEEANEVSSETGNDSKTKTRDSTEPKPEDDQQMSTVSDSSEGQNVYHQEAELLVKNIKEPNQKLSQLFVTNLTTVINANGNNLQNAQVFLDISKAAVRRFPVSGLVLNKNNLNTSNEGLDQEQFLNLEKDNIISLTKNYQNFIAEELSDGIRQIPVFIAVQEEQESDILYWETSFPLEKNRLCSEYSVNLLLMNHSEKSGTAENENMGNYEESTSGEQSVISENLVSTDSTEETIYEGESSSLQDKSSETKENFVDYGAPLLLVEKGVDGTYKAKDIEKLRILVVDSWDTEADDTAQAQDIAARLTERYDLLISTDPAFKLELVINVLQNMLENGELSQEQLDEKLINIIQAKLALYDIRDIIPASQMNDQEQLKEMKTDDKLEGNSMEDNSLNDDIMQDNPQPDNLISPDGGENGDSMSSE